MQLNLDTLPPEHRARCEMLAEFYELEPLDLLREQSMAVLRASLEELRAFEKATKEGIEPKPFRISLTVSERASRNLVNLIPERRNAHLCFLNDCNKELVEQSPFKDDVVARRHGHLANYEAIEVKPSRRKARKPKASAANDQQPATGAHAEPRAQAEDSPPEVTGVEPSEEVRRLYSAWADAYEEWEKQGDKFAPLPEYPPKLLEGLKHLAEKDPSYADLYDKGLRYVSNRKELMKRVKQQQRNRQAHGGAGPATT